MACFFCWNCSHDWINSFLDLFGYVLSAVKIINILLFFPTAGFFYCHLHLGLLFFGLFFNQVNTLASGLAASDGG